MNIKQALAALDPTNEDQWTADGLPRVEAVSTLVGSEVTRRQITDADPSFTRPQAGEFDPVGKPPSPEPTPAEPKPAEEKPAEEPVEAPPAEDAPAEEAPVEEPAEAPPEDDAEKSAHVAPEDDVVTMSELEVVRDPDLVERAIVEFGRQAAILAGRKEAIDKKLKDVGRRSARLQSVLNRYGRSNAHQQRDTLKRYQEAQNVARAKRVKIAQRFIEAGTTAQDVKAQLEGPSKIDAAMKQRKPGLGAVRPSYPRATVGST